MANLDSSFLIDLLDGDPAAVAKAAQLDREGIARFITAPAAAEVLIGGFLLGGNYLARTQQLVDALPVLPFDREACHRAGELGAELLRRGTPISQSDLFIAALSMRHGESLISRDRAFSRVPGLLLEPY